MEEETNLEVYYIKYIIIYSFFLDCHNIRDPLQVH